MAGTIFPYGLRLPTPAYAPLLQGNQLSSDVQRAHAAQLYDLSARIRLGLPYPSPSLPGAHAGGIRPFDPLHYLYGQQDPRSRFFHEEPKPSYSYIGLIAMAILSSKEKKLILSDIYQWITDNYPYFRTRGTGWRNSIRHNLSLNDCFIKAGRAANGKGHYWAVHQAVVEDFERGDFRRRRAQRKVRKAMGLSVPDEEDSPSPPPPSAEIIEWRKRVIAMNSSTEESNTSSNPDTSPLAPQRCLSSLPPAQPQILSPRLTSTPSVSTSRKRGFDVASLLAPDSDSGGSDNQSSNHINNNSNSSPKRRRLSEDAASDVDVDELNDVTVSSTASLGLNSSESPTSAYPNGSGIPSPILNPWSRPSAFHSLASTHAASWRPFLPSGFPLLRGNTPAFPQGFPTARIPLIQPPRIIVPSPRSSRDAEDEEEDDDDEHDRVVHDRASPDKEQDSV